jgi:hypothetical protein
MMPPSNDTGKRCSLPVGGVGRTHERVFEGATRADLARSPEKIAFYLRLGSAL